ncbi:serine protease [Apophysomyces ossiformis]|uniref:Serine protease n=1 Tax=Apophysomyces ossiformis TaxID=679940 RepID=A0A8H7BMG1_9FUNG|nr:serine protease [Apophysomyces ossiformis]
MLWITLFFILAVISFLPVKSSNIDDVLPAVPILNDTDRYIIVLKPDVPDHAITSHIQLFQHLRKEEDPLTNYSSIGQFRWYAGEFESEPFEAMMTASIQTTDEPLHDVVHYWAKDEIFSLQEMVQTNPPSWGLDRIDQRSGTDQQYRFAMKQGEGVTVYILDTGVYADHEDLKDRVTTGKTFVGSSPEDNNGHGTFVAGVCCGTRYGVAKEAKVVSVKTLDDQGNGRLSDLLAGLEYVVQQHMQNNSTKTIVNLSLGAKYSQATNDAIEQAIGLGLHFTIAAGNYGEDACLYSPGSAPGAVTVGAIDSDDSVAYYSNFGRCVDVFAPGTNIKSIWHTGTDATHTMTGTSMAAPHVAGAMALYLSQRDYTPAQLLGHIKHTSSLITQEFEIQNTDNNPNKTVLDNAVTDGYHYTRIPWMASSFGSLVNYLITLI